MKRAKSFINFFPARPRQLCQENIYIDRLRTAGAEEERVFVLISQRLEQVKLVNKRMTQTTNSHRRNYLSGQSPISQTDWFLKEWIKRIRQQWHTVLFLIYLLIDRERNKHVPSVCEVPFLALESHYRVWKYKHISNFKKKRTQIICHFTINTSIIREEIQKILNLQNIKPRQSEITWQASILNFKL